jgi:hypothetical protein
MTPRQRATLLGLAAAVAIAAVLIAVLSGGEDDGRAVVTPTEKTTAMTATTTATTPSPKTAAIIVRDGKPVGGVRRLRFEKHGTIAFVVRSDVADEVHFHGYDIAKDVAAGGSVRFSVPATIDGLFEVELEQRATQIAEIEVVP